MRSARRFVLLRPLRGVNVTEPVLSARSAVEGRPHVHFAVWAPRVLAFVVPLCVYAASARRDVWFWDTGEMDTVPWIAGIAHPTGFPAYVIAGFLFSHALPFGSVAFRMSLMSALAMSVAAWFVARIVEDGGLEPWIAMGCAWIFAFGSIAWMLATRAEVHAFAAAVIAATIFFSLRWHRTGEERDLYIAALLFGLGLAVHPVILLLVPGIVLLAIARSSQPRRWPRFAFAAALAAGFGAVWYLYLPLRSAYVDAHSLDPVHLLGLRGGAFWDYDHPASWRGFVALTGAAVFNPSGALRAIFSAATYRSLPVYVNQLYNEISSFGVSLAIGGAVAGWMRSRVRTVALLLFGAACIPFGLAFPPESDPHRYFLTSFLVASVLCGEAAGWLIRRVPRWRWLPALAPAVLAAGLFVANRWIFGLADDERARAIIVNVQRGTPSNAIVVANWSDAPPLAYAAYVEHSLANRIVLAQWLGNVTGQLPSWMRRRPVYALGYGQSAPGYKLALVGRHSTLGRVVAKVATH